MFKEVLVLGTGLDLNIALEFCARGLVDGRTLYFSEWNESFPKVESYLVGYGFDRFGLTLIKDFYSILKSVKDKDDMLAVFTGTGFGSLPDILREQEYKVFGAGKLDDLENNREHEKIIMSQAGIDIPNYFTAKTANELINRLQMMDPSAKWLLKTDVVSSHINTEVKTVQEILTELEGIPDVEKDMELNYLVEESVGGIEVACGAFFNGEDFLKPFMISFESEWGGYLYWTDESPIFDKGLGKLKDYLKSIGYKGVIDLNGIYNHNGNYYGLELVARFGVPWGRVFCKQIKNLDEVFEAVALGQDTKVELFSTDAYFISAFSNLEFKDTDDYVFIGKVYEWERDDPNKFGISFDKVVMDSEGDVYALPGYSRLFQMIGYGDDYFTAVDNVLELHSLCKQDIEFKDKKQELVEDIRDRIIFLESWIIQDQKGTTDSEEGVIDNGK